LIEPLVYREQRPLAPFRMEGREVPANSFWGRPRMAFVLRTEFVVEPANLESAGDTAGFGSPIRDSLVRDSSKRRFPEWALYLPLGEAGDFSHPEALVYIDGEPRAACDRHHQEIELQPDLCDGEIHSLELRGWTGLGGWNSKVEKPLYMGEPAAGSACAMALSSS
jgi:alpha-mannosidase